MTGKGEMVYHDLPTEGNKYRRGGIKNLDDLSNDEKKEILLNGWNESGFKKDNTMDWNAVKDLLEHAKVQQTRFPMSVGKIELFIPIELMQQAVDYAKSIHLDVELHDLDDFRDKTTAPSKER